jgi:3',5'-nucleoside bisphosphate phosphatase
MDPDLRIDLHLHSTASDGTASPAEVVEAAVLGGLGLIALTDHDTTAGVRGAQQAAEGRPLQVIPGIEVSAGSDQGEVHILGYGVDPDYPELVEHGVRAGRRRLDRMVAMVARLNELGIPVTLEAVETIAGVDRASLARPHLARALVEAGVVEHPWEAFDRYIGDGLPAFVSTDLFPGEEAIELIHRAGGVAVWAHPPEEAMDALLPRFKRAGLDGMEVYRPRQTADKTARLARRARSAGLLAGGGSDWHGPEGGALGAFCLQLSEVGPLLDRILAGS